MEAKIKDNVIKIIFVTFQEQFSQKILTISNNMGQGYWLDFLHFPVRDFITLASS